MNYSLKETSQYCLYMLPVILFFLSFPLGAQSYKFEQYGIEEGICHTSVYTINQDKNGFLWMGTGEGLCRFDGFEFVNASAFDSIPKAPVEASFKDKKGNLWFGHADGNLSVYDGLRFKFIDTKGLLKSKIVQIQEDNENNIWVATQSNGMFIFNARFKFEHIYSGFENVWLSTFGFTSDNKKLVVGTLEGLYIYEMHVDAKEVKQVQSFAKLEFVNIQSIYTLPDNNFLIGAEDAGLYTLNITNSDYKLEVMSDLGSNDLDVQYIFADSDKKLWIATFGNGAYRYSGDLKTTEEIIHFNMENGLWSTYIKTVFQDREGNIWLGTYDMGLARLMDESLVFYDLIKQKLSNDVSAIAMHENTVWYGSAGCLLKQDKGAEIKYTFYDRRNGLPADKISALYIDSSKNLWIGTSKSGLYKTTAQGNHVSRVHYSENSLENSINAITGNDKFIWVATNSGVIVYDLHTGRKEILTTTEGLPHNNIRHVFLDSKGILWVATKSNGLFALNKDKHLKIESHMDFEFTCIAEDSQGNLWAGTYGDGIFKFLSDTLVHLTTDNGLYSNYCYSIMGDGDYIWVGHRLGLSRITTSTNGIRNYGIEAGMTGDCNPNAVTKDLQGIILFGTTKNIVQFDRNKEKKNQVPPQINFTTVKLNDKEYPVTEDLILPYGLYKLRIDFIGINYKSPKVVVYQYKLDGYDLGWSDYTTNRYIQYPRIEDGEYKFLIKACNEDGLCNDRPMAFVIKVKKPFWKTWAFIISAITIGLVAVYLIIKIRERKQIKFQEYLQEKLDERTKEVVEQKEEIESINRDITDSINYAQRIQASILPPIQKLQDNFSGSFVFYLPRDIVSGDFYWFDKTNKDTFIIVCADSTGHGVPGAFMSMIGTTLIKDICQRPDVTSPTKVLNVLDNEIQSTLNQSLEAGKSSDGMDIIVCEINIRTLQMRYASAMRPLLVYKDGNITYYKGSQNSIGGEGDKIEKVFEEDEVQLSKGDIIYLFSDGYTDQFGGAHGKKFKMVRLKNLLKDIHEKPMEEQYKFVKSNFELWKDQFPQVDDVLFMGIKI